MTVSSPAPQLRVTEILSQVCIAEKTGAPFFSTSQAGTQVLPLEGQAAISQPSQPMLPVGALIFPFPHLATA